MAELISVIVRNQSEEGYDGMLAALRDAVSLAPGFILHAAYRDDEGNWRVLEVWESRLQADQFFVQHVSRNLPAGVRPKRTVHTLHSLVLPAPAG